MHLQRAGPCSPVFSKTRARAAFAAAALQASDAAFATAMHPKRQATVVRSPSRAAKRKAHLHSCSEHPRKRAAVAVPADAEESPQVCSARSSGLLQIPNGAGSLLQEAVSGGQPLAPHVSVAPVPAASSPKLSAAESIGSDPGQPPSSGDGGTHLPGKLRFKADAALGPWRGQPPLTAAGHIPLATGAGAGGSAGTADSSPLPARAPGSKENLPAGLEVSLGFAAGKARAQAGSPACVPFWLPQQANSSPFLATLPASSAPGCPHQPATGAKEPALLEAMGRMVTAIAPLPMPLSMAGGHSAAGKPHACPPLFCSPPEPFSPMELLAKHVGAAPNAGCDRAAIRAAEPVLIQANMVRMPLADVTLAASNAPPDTAHASQGTDSAATAAPAGAWGI